MADVAKSKGAFNFRSARFANKLTREGMEPEYITGEAVLLRQRCG